MVSVVGDFAAGERIAVQGDAAGAEEGRVMERSPTPPMPTLMFPWVTKLGW